MLEDHQKVFPDVPIIGFKNNKNLKPSSVWGSLANINDVSGCKPLGGKIHPCQLCSNMKNTSTFKSRHLNEVYQIKKNYIWKKYNCNYEMVETIKQNNGSIVTMICARTNNYISTHRNFLKEEKPSTKRVTRNVFTNINSRLNITRFVTGISQ